MIETPRNLSKKEVNLNTQDDEKEGESIREQIKEQCEKALDNASGYQTNVWLEWNINKNCKTFTVRKEVVNLLGKLGQMDPSIYVMLSVTKEVWKTPTEIPSGTAFTKGLDVHQKTPLKGPPKIVSFLTLFSSLCLNALKFETEVYICLQHHKTFIKPDFFMLNDVVSPGILVELHAVYVCKDDLEVELKAKQQKCPVHHRSL
eukprot:12927506-Ditylum_brightwellii.AAC.1